MHEHAISAVARAAIGDRIVEIGVNYYIWDHNFKIQADYTFKDEEGPNLANNVFQIQLQLDY